MAELIMTLSIALPRLGEVIIPSPWAQPNDFISDSEMKSLMHGTQESTNTFAALPSSEADPTLWVFKNLDSHLLSADGFFIEVAWGSSPVSDSPGNLNLAPGAIAVVPVYDLNSLPRIKSVISGNHSLLMFWAIGIA